MKIKFSKYHGAGNDFIMLDGAQFEGLPTDDQIESWCDRHKGIGGDGLIILYPVDDREVRMHYFNSDGKESSLCGNGGRCVAAWCRREAGFQENIIIHASDGKHQAKILTEHDHLLQVSLSMNDAGLPKKRAGGYFINTGSPHHVQIVDGVDTINVFAEGKKIRMSHDYSPSGTNVNFISPGAEYTAARTYERGVEAETLACGTGAVAVAMVSVFLKGKHGKCYEKISMPGGNLAVEFEYHQKGFSSIKLKGPAEFVFSGIIDF